MAKAFTDDRAAQAQQIPGQQRAGRAKMKGGMQTGAGAGKENRVLRQPLQRRAFRQRQALM